MVIIATAMMLKTYLLLSIPLIPLSALRVPLIISIPLLRWTCNNLKKKKKKKLFIKITGRAGGISSPALHLSVIVTYWTALSCWVFGFFLLYIFVCCDLNHHTPYLVTGCRSDVCLCRVIARWVSASCHRPEPIIKYNIWRITRVYEETELFCVFFYHVYFPSFQILNSARVAVSVGTSLVCAMLKKKKKKKPKQYSHLTFIAFRHRGDNGLCYYAFKDRGCTGKRYSCHISPL